jgi:hypothetical protein
MAPGVSFAFSPFLTCLAAHLLTIFLVQKPKQASEPYGRRP